MAVVHRVRRPLLARRFGMGVLAFVFLVMGSGLALALDAADQSDMSVSIVPNGDAVPMTEVPVSESAGHHGTANLPGTVTALLTLDDDAVQPSTGPWTAIETNLTVTDHRGTASGWDALISAAGSESEWLPLLMANRQETLVRVVPFATLSTRDSGVNVGGTLGPIELPMAVLRAGPGAGAGMYIQRLVISLPSAPNQHLATFTVQLPFAP